jgi:hypothetical protein
MVTSFYTPLVQPLRPVHHTGAVVRYEYAQNEQTAAPGSCQASPAERAEVEAKENLKAAYQRFMDERDAARRDEAGKDLMRAVFGKDAIADDTVL